MVLKSTFAVGALLAALILPAVAGQEHLDIIYEQCGIQLNKPPAVCSCMSENAGTRLNENQQAFMAAQVTANGAEIQRIQALMSQDEAMVVMQFMTTAIAACGG